MGVSLFGLMMVILLVGESGGATTTYSSRLIHRFSDEVKAIGVSRKWESGLERRSLEYYKVLMSSDLQRQNMKLGPRYRLIFPSEGSKTMSFGNDFGWLHYTWIDVGTPNVSFLVALDAGSDLLWLPCDCIQCAPLSASYYSTSLDRDLNEYSPSGSSTSKHLPCSHELCESTAKCESPKQLCPYTVDYFSENTSSSGMLVEDTFHLASDSEDSSPSIPAPVIIGCGRKQSGGYLNGVAPDGLMGLGFGEISVPSVLAKRGLVADSFSMCFNNDGEGRIFFGDKGPAAQQATPFLPSDGKFVTYIVGVESFCIAGDCLGQTKFNALVDSGTSFTFLPEEVYKRVAKEFDSRVNAKRSSNEGSPFQYCYESSANEATNLPSMMFTFPSNNSFVVHNPAILVYDNEEVIGFCLALQPIDGDVGIIGQNFMTNYRMVFDRDNMKLGWSRSECQDLSEEKTLPLTPPASKPTNPLPTNEQQATPPNGHAVAPALAGRTHSKPSAAASHDVSCRLCWLMKLLPLLLLLWYAPPSLNSTSFLAI